VTNRSCIIIAPSQNIIRIQPPTLNQLLSTSQTFPAIETLTPIGRGLTSDVYEWGEGRVLKLLHARVPRNKAEREFVATRALHAAGVPVPATYEFLQVEGRWGIIFERIEGISMFKHFQSRPWALLSGARQLAELQAQLHSHSAPPELPTQRDQISAWIDAAADFSDAQIQSARECLERMPVGNVVCHGDFHPENVILSPRGPILIDWSTGTRGHPLGDVCRTAILIQTGELPDSTPVHVRLLVNISRRLLLSAYLRRYLQLRSVSLSEIHAWRPAQLAGASAWRASRLN
jgi:uncharacterized protein (TIGR02172 family)